MSFEKYYNENGEVGVLYSPGYGAGWSTWNDSAIRARMCMDKELVKLALDKKWKEVEELAESLGEGVCVLGITQLSVEFLPKGTAFTIREYDGSESIEIPSQVPCMVT